MGTTHKKYSDISAGYLSRYSAYAFDVFRIGLGAVILLAGAHKLVDPGAWSKYFAPWFVDLWPTSLVSLHLLTLLEGVFEILLGVALLAGWYTTLVAGVWALVMVSIIVNLATGALMTGKFVDVMVRDVGLFALALGLTLLSAAEDAETR